MGLISRSERVPRRRDGKYLPPLKESLPGALGGQGLAVVLMCWLSQYSQTGS